MRLCWDYRTVVIEIILVLNLISSSPTLSEVHFKGMND
jgi:hypothetical protein